MYKKKGKRSTMPLLEFTLGFNQYCQIIESENH